MKDLILYLWQLPQNIVGFLLSLVFKTEKSLIYKGVRVRINHRLNGKAISLGNYIFFGVYPYDSYSWRDVKHEWGHARQSVYLGPLYLFVVGIPSLIHNLFSKYDPSDPKKYYRFYCEKWADELAGIKR